MSGFFNELKVQRWDDHRYYHHSRINQSLHFFSAMSFAQGVGDHHPGHRVRFCKRLANKISEMAAALSRASNQPSVRDDPAGNATSMACCCSRAALAHRSWPRARSGAPDTTRNTAAAKADDFTGTSLGLS